MSLKNNIIANYASQIYVTLIGIVMVPLYIKYMGAEAYGLVGFFAMLQAWFALLDIGLSPTIARETARFHGGATDALNFRRLVRALEGIFFSVAAIGCCMLLLVSDFIATDWLQAKELPISDVTLSVQLMAFAVALRWMCGLYRGAITGAEKLVWLGVFNSTIGTLRFVLVVPLLIFSGATPVIFFSFQLVVAVVEFGVLVFYAYRQFPAVPPGIGLPWDWSAIRPVLKFSLSIAFTSSVWVLVTQTDKLILSKILPLAEYGYFTLAVLVAGGIMMISGPISNAIMPRMVRLEAQGDHMGLLALYRQATQVVAVIGGAVSLTLAFCAEPLLLVWTSDLSLAKAAAPILALYSLGNGVLVLSAFPYYLQYAKGDVTLHLIGNALFVSLLTPAIIFAATKYGGLGAGRIWLAMNLLTFFAWLPFVHRRFERGLNRSWYLVDILPIVSAMGVVALLLSYLPVDLGEATGAALAFFIGYGALVLAAGLLASSYCRARAVESLIKPWIANTCRGRE